MTSVLYGPADDPDGDGMPNAMEFAAGTSPADANSRPVLHFEKRPGAAPVISLPVSVSAGFHFGVKSSLDLQTWQPSLINDLSSITPGNFTTQIIPVNGLARMAFLRVIAMPQ